MVLKQPPAKRQSRRLFGILLIAVLFHCVSSQTNSRTRFGRGWGVPSSRRQSGRFPARSRQLQHLNAKAALRERARYQLRTAQSDRMLSNPPNTNERQSFSQGRTFTRRTPFQQTGGDTRLQDRFQPPVSRDGVNQDLTSSRRRASVSRWQESPSISSLSRRFQNFRNRRLQASRRQRQQFPTERRSRPTPYPRARPTTASRRSRVDNYRTRQRRVNTPLNARTSNRLLGARRTTGQQRTGQVKETSRRRQPFELVRPNPTSSSTAAITGSSGSSVRRPARRVFHLRFGNRKRPQVVTTHAGSGRSQASGASVPATGSLPLSSSYNGRDRLSSVRGTNEAINNQRPSSVQVQTINRFGGGGVASQPKRENTRVQVLSDRSMAQLSPASAKTVVHTLPSGERLPVSTGGGTFRSGTVVKTIPSPSFSPPISPVNVAPSSEAVAQVDTAMSPNAGTVQAQGTGTAGTSSGTAGTQLGTVNTAGANSVMSQPNTGLLGMADPFQLPGVPAIGNDIMFRTGMESLPFGGFPDPLAINRMHSPLFPLPAWNGSSGGLSPAMRMMGINHGSQLNPFAQQLFFGDTQDPPDTPDPPGKKGEVEAEDMPPTTTTTTTTAAPTTPQTRLPTTPVVPMSAMLESLASRISALLSKAKSVSGKDSSPSMQPQLDILSGSQHTVPDVPVEPSVVKESAKLTPTLSESAPPVGAKLAPRVNRVDPAMAREPAEHKLQQHEGEVMQPTTRLPVLPFLSGLRRKYNNRFRHKLRNAAKAPPRAFPTAIVAETNNAAKNVSSIRVSGPEGRVKAVRVNQTPVSGGNSVPSHVNDNMAEIIHIAEGIPDPQPVVPLPGSVPLTAGDRHLAEGIAQQPNDHYASRGSSRPRVVSMPKPVPLRLPITKPVAAPAVTVKVIPRPPKTKVPYSPAVSRTEVASNAIPRPPLASVDSVLPASSVVDRVSLPEAAAPNSIPRPPPEVQTLVETVMGSDGVSGVDLQPPASAVDSGSPSTVAGEVPIKTVSDTSVGIVGPPANAPKVIPRPPPERLSPGLVAETPTVVVNKIPKPPADTLHASQNIKSLLGISVDVPKTGPVSAQADVVISPPVQPKPVVEAPQTEILPKPTVDKTGELLEQLKVAQTAPDQSTTAPISELKMKFLDILNNIRQLWDSRVPMVTELPTLPTTTTTPPTTTVTTTMPTTTTTTVAETTAGGEVEIEAEDMTTTMWTTTTTFPTTVTATVCDHNSPTFSCKGKDLFANIDTMGPWCLGKCIKGNCVTSVCDCSCVPVSTYQVPRRTRKWRRTTTTTSEPPTTIEAEEIEAEDMVSTTTQAPVETTWDYVTTSESFVSPPLRGSQGTVVNAVRIKPSDLKVTWGTEVRANAKPEGQRKQKPREAARRVAPPRRNRDRPPRNREPPTRPAPTWDAPTASTRRGNWQSTEAKKRNWDRGPTEPTPTDRPGWDSAQTQPPPTDPPARNRDWNRGRTDPPPTERTGWDRGPPDRPPDRPSRNRGWERPKDSPARDRGWRDPPPPPRNRDRWRDRPRDRPPVDRRWNDPPPRSDSRSWRDEPPRDRWRQQPWERDRGQSWRDRNGGRRSWDRFQQSGWRRNSFSLRDRWRRQTTTPAGEEAEPPEAGDRR